MDYAYLGKRGRWFQNDLRRGQIIDWPLPLSDLTPTLLAWIMLIYVDNILIDQKATSTGFEAKIP